MGRALRTALFDPLLGALSGRRRLLLAPDGDISRLPFEVLPNDDGRRLIDDYCISYLGCGRDVLRFQAQAGKAGEPVVAADPDFDLRDDSLPSRTEAAWGRRSRDLGESEVSFDRLPATRGEGERIARLLKVRPWLRRKSWKRGSNRLARRGCCTWPPTATSSPTNAGTPRRWPGPPGETWAASRGCGWRTRCCVRG